MLKSLRNSRPALTAILLAASLAVGATGASAQSGTTIQTPKAIGLTRSQLSPYNFTGRIFALDFLGVGSGTLIRRHTVLTAGHVTYEPTLGFTASATFTRGLYGNNQYQSQQVTAVAALSGYQSAADTLGNTSSQAFAQDLGYMLTGNSAPKDEDWAEFISTPNLLTSPSSEFFVLGYPAVTFDARTLAYVVPQTPFVPTGTSTNPGSYTNTDYTAEPGMSGGPVYVVLGVGLRYVAAETVGGLDDSTGAFNVAFVRAIDKTAKKFLTAAEYTAGLIKRVKINGPATVQRGTTVRYVIKPVFTVPNVGGGKAKTDRYDEMQLKSTAVTLPNQAGVTVKKLSNTVFEVTFADSAALRSGSTVTLQVYYNKTNLAPGKSSRVISIQ